MVSSTMNEPDNEARVLVGVMTSQKDMHIARELHWYRIPLARAPQCLAAEYLALYQTAAFGDERWAINYYAPILRYRIATRIELLPDEQAHPRASDRYYCLDIGTLERLPLSVPSARLRRITFIATTFGQLCRATDVRDLWNPNEDQILSDDIVWGAGLAGKSLR